jgi:hypothetical protein
MTDDYQDARLLSQNEDSATVEVTYYPLNTVRDGISENPNWKRDYAHMTKYLAPTPTENWDEQMRSDLVAALRQDGIDPDSLTDRQVVTQVSRWLKRRSRFTDAFAVWYVHYPAGKPEVFPLLRPAFDREKEKAGAASDQVMFDQEVLGRSMFYGRRHGSCTSYSVYLATVLRALGIPTRIVFFIPPVDSNDSQQKQMLFSAIHHHQVRTTIRHGLPRGGFSNHLFNEVFVGNRWVRVNYDVLGQNTLDEDYLGLLTHILTTDSLSHVPMAQTWGWRYAIYPRVEPKLSSVNPYRLLRVSDHFGSKAAIANPEVTDEELRAVTIKEAYWKGHASGRDSGEFEERRPDEAGLLYRHSRVHSALRWPDARFRGTGEPSIRVDRGGPSGLEGYAQRDEALERRPVSGVGRADRRRLPEGPGDRRRVHDSPGEHE